MNPNISSNSTIAKNSFLLYLRMIAVMVINIYTVRIVLRALGEEDYGIYNVVSGFVSSLSFINNALQSATQRFYSYAIGKGNEEELNNIFNISLKCYIIIAIFLLLVGETFGLWFINTHLVIPENRILAANIVFQFAIFSVITSFLYLPYSSLLIAREKMNIWAYISIANSVILLLLSILLKYQGYDRLILYSIFVFVAWLFVFFCYKTICKKIFSGICTIKKGYSRRLLKDILSFSGWSIYGHFAGVLNNQGNNILVNIFFGPVINAARAISLQVHTAIVTFAGNFSMSFRPPIVKSYAAKDFIHLKELYLLSNKCIFYSLMMVCIPLSIETNYVLMIWLGTVSTSMISFTRWAIWYAFVISLSAPITTVMQATGNIKRYHLIVETITILSMPLTYVFFKFGFPSVTTLVITFFVFLFAHFGRIVILGKELKELSCVSYFKDFMIVGIVISAISYVISFCLSSFFSEGCVRLLFVFAANFSVIIILSYFFAINKNEKQQIKKIIRHVFGK